ESGGQIAVPGNLLVHNPDGSFFLPMTLEEVERYRIPAARSSETVLPLAEEKLRVEKRRAESGKTRLKKKVEEREELIDEPLLFEEVEIERVAVNRVVDRPVPIRQEGDQLVVS